MKRKEYFPICSLKPELPQYQRCYKKWTLQSNIFHEHSFCFKSKKHIFCFSYHMFNLLLPFLLSQANWTNTTHFLQIDTIYFMISVVVTILQVTQFNLAVYDFC